MFSKASAQFRVSTVAAGARKCSGVFARRPVSITHLLIFRFSRIQQRQKKETLADWLDEDVRRSLTGGYSIMSFSRAGLFCSDLKEGLTHTLVHSDTPHSSKVH